MFIVLLQFSENKSKAKDHMDGHNIWLKQGFDDGVFLLAGSIETGRGGAVIAHDISLTELEQRVQTDPFVSEKVVVAEIVEISPKVADDRLKFLVS